MTLHSLIETEYPRLLDIAKKICKSSVDHRDVTNSMVVELLSLPLSKQQHIIDNNYLLYRFAKMTHLSVYSKTSPYYRQNLARLDHLPFEEETFDPKIINHPFLDIDSLKLDINKVLDTYSDWYTKDIYYRHIKGASFKTISKETGVSVTWLWLTFNNAKKLIREHINYQDYIV